MPLPVGLQLYSLRDDCAQDFLGTIRKVAEIGYQGVEFAGYFGHSPADIASVLKETGLAAAGAHVGIDQFDDDKIDATLDFHAEIGCTWLILPWLPEETRNTPEACHATAQRLTALAEKVEANGFRTGFHAHDGDMKPLEGGPSAWYLIGQQTPESFILQYDTGNGMAGGADPLQPLLDFPGRGQSVHLKTFPIGTPLGEDQIPWKEIIQTCQSTAATEWLIIEHETYLNTTPLESVTLNYNNLKPLL